MERKPPKNGYDDDQSEKIRLILAPLKPQYQQFVTHYCHYLSKTAAAIAAGYEESCANVTGFHIYNRPEIREAVTEYFRATAFIPEDNIAGIKRLAEIDVSEYFTWREEWVNVRKRVPIQQIIDQTLYELKVEDMVLMDSTDLRPIEKTTMMQTLRALQLRLKRLRSEQRLNPKAMKFINVDELKREKVIDIDKVVADKVPIKSIKHKEHGVELELYSTAEAKRDLARIAGSFEKDNIQRPQAILVAPVVNMFGQGSPPLANAENDIQDATKDV